PSVAIYTGPPRKVGEPRGVPRPPPAAPCGEPAFGLGDARHDGGGQLGRRVHRGHLRELAIDVVVSAGRRRGHRPSPAARSGASRWRAEKRRDLTVFSGMSSVWAISSYESSAKCRITTTSRYSGVSVINAA